LKALTNKKIAMALAEVADAMEIRGDNPFRIRAHRRAARTVEDHPGRVADLYAEGGEKTLQELPGVGAGIAAKIAELLETGALAEMARMEEQVPEGLRELLQVPGLGPKGVKALRDALGIANLQDLERVCAEGRVREVAGFGEAKEAGILKAVRAFQGRERRFRLSEAEEYAEQLRRALLAVQGVERVELAGSYRRRRDSVGDLDILVTARKGSGVMAALAGHETVQEVVARGETKSSVRLENDMQVDLRLVDPDCYGAALLYFTGSKAHNVALRTAAKARGIKISEYGVFAGNRRAAGATEEEIYQFLGLRWIPPELREDRGEIEAAAAGNLPDLVDLGDIRGDLQMHTTRSDGRNTPAEMAGAARALGYEYIAITEHSKAVTVAGGLDDEEVLAWCEELDREDGKAKGVRILKGMEVDILKEGDLDLAPETLSALDVVVATIHSHFALPRKVQTRRVVDAMRSGLVHVWGHPTTRMIGRRGPIDADMEEIFAVCAEEGVAVEINAHDSRLDLDDRGARTARQAGCRIVISTDAHSTEGLEMMRYGVGIARRAWLEPGDVLNTLPLEAFLEAIRRD